MAVTGTSNPGTSDPGYFSRRRNGWGIGLYRNRNQSWVAGVCAGLGDYWGVPYWMVRLMAVMLLVMTGSTAFWAYIVGIVVVSPNSPSPQSEGTREGSVARRHPRRASSSTERPSRERFSPGKSSLDRSSRAPRGMAHRLDRAQSSLDAAFARLDTMETYVTRRRRQLDTQFRRL